jgi:xylulose-5-phosphate/fructose-6-phosphate phosphoketolase
MFDALFTADKTVIFNFHGYPSAVQQLLFHRGNSERFEVNGYLEEGTTTTPFDMLVRNQASRFHLAIRAIQLASGRNPAVAVGAMEAVSHFEYILRDHKRYIDLHGDDPEVIKNWTWKR